MRRLGLVTDPRFRAHDPGPHHPECPERLEVLEALFAAGDLRDVPRVPVRSATEEELTRVHRPALVRAVAANERSRLVARRQVSVAQPMELSADNVDVALTAEASANVLRTRTLRRIGRA